MRGWTVAILKQNRASLGKVVQAKHTLLWAPTQRASFAALFLLHAMRHNANKFISFLLYFAAL